MVLTESCHREAVATGTDKPVDHGEAPDSGVPGSYPRALARLAAPMVDEAWRMLAMGNAVPGFGSCAMDCVAMGDAPGRRVWSVGWLPIIVLGIG
mmetsp:Transcript_135346/g.234009  ORF Transcript_135346/g.234009 Transcript_135346/m.234009 type:complete len:95 (+) Transcript_135346:1323-1607(+)